MCFRLYTIKQPMSLSVSLDKISSFRDPRLELLDHKIKPQKKREFHLPETCSLLSSAAQLFKDTSSHKEETPKLQKKQDITRNRRPAGSGEDCKEIKSTKYDSTEIILYDNIMNQPKAVLEYLLDKYPEEFQVSQKQEEILSNWIMCLTREDRMEIQKDRTWFPNPRNIELRHISEGLDEIYGVGTKRRLRPGEEASLLDALQKFFVECNNNPQLIVQREKTIIESLLDKSGNEELVEFPFCMRQLECHFKLMATKWRFGTSINLNNKAVERALQSASYRGHFLDLNKTDSRLVQYLLKHSTREDRSMLSSTKLRKSMRSSEGILKN